MRDEKGRFIKGNISVKFWLGKKRTDVSGKNHWSFGKKRPEITGKNNHLWKDEKVGYRSLHRWVERQLGKANKCMRDITHKSTRYHWANISKQYKRDITDWIQLCPSCNSLDRIGRRVSP